MFWVYKCNSKNREYQRAYGDWNDFFIGRRATEWGSTDSVRALAQAGAGDTVLAYQTDRNELVGLARVVRLKAKGHDQELILEPGNQIGVKVRPLKAIDPRVAAIPAFFKVGPVQTLYSIDVGDVRRILKAAGQSLRLEKSIAKSKVASVFRGAGFGDPVANRKVEAAAVRYARRHFERRGWHVEDVSARKIGYDLRCSRGSVERHVEVKGVTGRQRQFIITAGERACLTADRKFVLALITNAVSSAPTIDLFPASIALRRFVFRPLSFMVVC